MEKKLSENKRFSLISRIKSTSNAARGIVVFMKTTHNAWMQLFFGALAVYLGFILNISSVEWVLVVFAITFVILAETINTAIEIDINLTSPTYHPYARDTKDVAAGAVFISVITAIIIGLIIFYPYLAHFMGF